MKDNKSKRLPQFYEGWKSEFTIGFIPIKSNIRARIIGIKQFTFDELKRQVNTGEKFIIFKYGMFFLFFFAVGTSHIYFGKNKVNTIIARLMYIGLSIVSMAVIVGIVYLMYSAPQNWLNPSDASSIAINLVIWLIAIVGVLLPGNAIIINLKGGIDVTDEVMKYIEYKESLVEETTKKGIMKKINDFIGF